MESNPPRQSEKIVLATAEQAPKPSVEEAQIYPEAQQFYIPSLDGIRALAFMVVFLAHALWTRLPAAFGVTTFFFLSGYLITTLMRRELERYGQFDLKAFYLRRILRIFPPFYLILAFATIVQWVTQPAILRWDALAAQVLQVSNYYRIIMGDIGIGIGMTINWSLAVEEHFYLLFPVCFLALRQSLSLRGQATVLAICCALALLWRIILVYGFDVSEPRIAYATDTRADSILLGCIMALVANPVMDQASVWRKRVDLALVPVAVLGLYFSWAIRDPHFHETLRYTIQGLVLFPLFTVAIRYHDRFPFRFLNWRPIRFLGVLSYSLYLIHLNILEWVHWTKIGRVPGAVVSLLISVVLAFLVHKLVELPCARLRKRLSQLAEARKGVAL